MATVSFPIPATPLPAGTTTLPFTDVTAQTAGHSSYAVALDVSAWPTSAHAAFGTTFRVDGGTVVPGAALTTTGGVHRAMDGTTVMVPSCTGPLPSFATTLEMAATITVPTPGSISGSLSLS